MLVAVFRPGNVPLHPEDRRILEIVQELCRELGIYKESAHTVSWTDRVGLARIPQDQVMFLRGDVKLPKILMGKLDPEEWRPLLASSLIYFYKWKWRPVRVMLTTVIPATLSIPFILVGFERSGLLTGLSVTLRLLVVMLPTVGIMLYAFLRYFRGFKRLWLEADRYTARLVGRETFLQVLRKMDGLGLRGGPGFLRPSIAERIRFLEGPG